MVRERKDALPLERLDQAEIDPRAAEELFQQKCSDADESFEAAKEEWGMDAAREQTNLEQDALSKARQENVAAGKVEKLKHVL